VIGNIEKGFDWESLLKEIREKVEAVAKAESKEIEEQNFIDPSIIPMKVSKFCGLIDLSREAKIILNSYKKPEKHFMYPVEGFRSNRVLCKAVLGYIAVRCIDESGE